MGRRRRPIIPDRPPRLTLPRPLFRAAILIFLCCFSVEVMAASREAARAKHSMVAGPEPIAVAEGLLVLKEGGNAVDAAVTMGFVLAVTFPEAGNLGGGGFMLIRPTGVDPVFIDYRETAPTRATAGMFLDKAGQVIPRASTHTWQAVGVPGSVAGLALALERHGTIALRRALAPAIRLARAGFEVTQGLEATLATEKARLGEWPASRAIFFKEDRPLREGEMLIQSDLATTLESIARDGPRAFYEGATARILAQAMEAQGGLITMQDLAGYRAEVRRPIEGSYRGFGILTAPPPSSGGVALLQVLGMIEPHAISSLGQNSSASIHLVAEAMRRAFADRSRWLGDPAFVDVPVRGLLARKYLLGLMASFDPEQASPSAAIRPGEPIPYESESTTHWSVVDRGGWAVSTTTTLNDYFGNGAVAPGLGFLLNNEMDDFSARPGTPNLYGLIGGEANRIQAGKRMLSSMTPTIILPPGATATSRPWLVLGSPGGPAIITAMLQTIVNLVDFDMELQAAIDAPRFHHQWLPDILRMDRLAYPADVLDALRRRGHIVEAQSPRGRVEAILCDPEDAWLRGASDARGRGTAAGN